MLRLGMFFGRVGAPARAVAARCGRPPLATRAFVMGRISLSMFNKITVHLSYVIK